MSKLADPTETASPDRKPRRRRFFVARVVLVALALLGSAAIWRSTSLHGLPRIDDPFATSGIVDPPLPDSENAFTFYRLAYDRYVDAADGSRRLFFTDPSEVTPGLLAHLEANRESLGRWLDGTKLDRGALIVDIATVKGDVNLDVTAKLRNRFSQLANLRAFQCQEQGDYAGAWAWIRAHLRSSRHAAMSGFLVERVLGFWIYRNATEQAFHWADDPKLDLRLLRQALADVLAIDRMTPLNSRMVRYECIAALNALNDPVTRELVLTRFAPIASLSRDKKLGLKLTVLGGTLINEPERSRRVIHLIAANWLAAIDLPPEERRRRAVTIGSLTLYETTPGADAPIEPADLARRFNSTLYANALGSSGWPRLDTFISRDERARASLIVHLAEQLYLRERGKPPARVEDLVGPYLNALPAGHADPPEPTGTPR